MANVVLHGVPATLGAKKMVAKRTNQSEVGGACVLFTEKADQRSLVSQHVRSILVALIKCLVLLNI